MKSKRGPGYYIRRYTRTGVEPLSDNARRFVEANAGFWERAGADGAPEFSRDGENGGFVLMELPSNAYIQHYIAAMTQVAARVFGARALGMVVPADGVTGTRHAILSSYGPIDLFRLTGAQFARAWAGAHARASATFRRLSTPEDVLRLEVDGMEVGDLIYDPILRSGYATLDRVDDRVLRMLRTFYLHRALVLRVLATRDIRYAVFSHHIGIRAGVFFRYLLRARVPVLLVRGVGETNLKEYHGLEQLRDYPLRPEPRFVEHMRSGIEDEIIRLSDDYLERRMGQQTNDKDAALAFKASNRTYTSRADFAGAFGLDPAKPNVFVMLHAFNDHPHMFGVDAILHGDYYRWFQETLRIARSEPRFNWIFKEHPSAEHYQTRDVDLAELFAVTDEPNVRFLGRNADFNARSLRYVADTVVTCIGTAGLEYAALGKPALLAGRGPYSGFGFTHEPATIDEYERLLRSVDSLAPSSEQGQRLARLVLYFQLNIARNTPFPFAPDYSHDQVSHLDEERFYADTAALLSDYPAADANLALRKFAGFIADESATQYVDFDLHPYLEGATAGRKSAPA